jgi:hypothetical protein
MMRNERHQDVVCYRNGGCHSVLRAMYIEDIGRKLSPTPREENSP